MTALITGANRGIGRALFDRVPGAIGTSRKGEDGFLPLEVSDPSSQAALGRRLAGHPIDLLVCNAGVYLDKGQELETGFEAALWAETFAANVTGVFLTIKTLLPSLRLGTDPKIAIIASRMGSQSLAPGGAYIYRASKAAAVNLARNLACDLKGDGIAVGAYHPGWVRTDMGGGSADVSTAQSANGLIERFSELDLTTTGCFRSFDGEDLPL